jgi:hypothetical protein
MPSDPIVIPFDIAERFTPGLGHIFKYPAFHQLSFEARKETFGLRVVITALTPVWPITRDSYAPHIDSRDLYG